MLARWDEELGLVNAEFGDAEFDVPDDEWEAYLRVLGIAKRLEDDMRAKYAMAPTIPPDLAALKGLIPDDEILHLASLRTSGAAPAPNAPRPPSVLPAVKPYTPPPCEHRTQTGGSRGNPTVRCADCGQVLIARTGVRAGLGDPNLTGSPMPPAKADRHGFPDYSP